MFDLDVIRPALLANLADLCEEQGLQQSPYMLALPTPPTLQIAGVTEINYDITMQRGGDANFIAVQVFVSMVADVGGQMKLDKMLKSSGSTSVKEAIESDTTLGGIIDDLRVTRSMGHQQFQRPGDNDLVIGSTWIVQIETTG